MTTRHLAALAAFCACTVYPPIDYPIEGDGTGGRGPKAAYEIGVVTGERNNPSPELVVAWVNNTRRHWAAKCGVEVKDLVMHGGYGMVIEFTDAEPPYVWVPVLDENGKQKIAQSGKPITRKSHYHGLYQDNRATIFPRPDGTVDERYQRQVAQHELSHAVLTWSHACKHLYVMYGDQHMIFKAVGEPPAPPGGK